MFTLSAQTTKNSLISDELRRDQSFSARRFYPLLVFAHQEVWTDKRVERAFSIAHRLFYGADHEGAFQDFLEDLLEKCTQWMKIAEQPDLPTTAQLRATFRRPSRQQRAVALYEKINSRIYERREICLKKARPFKTFKARHKEEARVLNDLRLHRLTAHQEHLKKLVPNVQRLAWEARR